jgi:hypothetical protein
MPEAAKVIAARVITSKPKSTSIPVGYIVIMFSTCHEKYADKVFDVSLFFEYAAFSNILYCDQNSGIEKA